MIPNLLFIVAFPVTVKDVFALISPDTLKYPPTKEFDVTVDVPTTSIVSFGFVFPMPNFPEEVRDINIEFVE